MHRHNSHRCLLVIVAISLLSFSCKPRLAKTESENRVPPGLPEKSPFDKPIPPPPVAKGLSQAAVTGLLVSTGSGADFIGEASRMNATVLDDAYFTGTLEVKFNQEVGDSTLSAMREVLKFHKIRNEASNQAQLIEIGFGEQYSSKNGPSAAVACALLVESILTGKELDPSFAVTGDMNADGTVQPVGGIDGKIRGATKGGAVIVAIPKGNVTTLSDLAVLEETTYFINIQIFSISTFEEALELASAESDRSAAVRDSITAFSEVQKVLIRPDGAKLISNPHVISRLEEVLRLTPNHESARHLLLVGQRKTSAQLSLSGSFLQIYRSVKPMRSALSEGVIPEDTRGLSESIFTLRRVRSRLDPRTRGCADALEDFAETIKKIGDIDLSAARSRVPKLVDQLNADWTRVVDEYEKIRSDTQIQEDLML